MSKVGTAALAIFILLAVVFGFVDDFRLVTVCLGARGVCSTATKGPDALRAPGLTVQPGQTIDVRFPDGAYGLTVVADVPGRDATVEAFTPTCEADPDDSTCIDDDNFSR